MQRKSTAVLIGAAVVVVGAGAVWAWGSSPAGQAPPVTNAAHAPDPTGSPTPPPPLTFNAPSPSALSENEAGEVQRVEEVATAIVSARNEMGERGDGGSEGIEAIATGFALGELQSFAREQLDLGYRQIGEAKVTSMTPGAINLTAEPATMTISVCVDASEIDIVDAAGNSYREAMYNPGHPVKHDYTAVFIDERWKISDHTIPDHQDCPAAS